MTIQRDRLFTSTFLPRNAQTRKQFVENWCNIKIPISYHTICTFFGTAIALFANQFTDLQICYFTVFGNVPEFLKLFCSNAFHTIYMRVKLIFNSYQLAKKNLLSTMVKQKKLKIFCLPIMNRVNTLLAKKLPVNFQLYVFKKKKFIKWRCIEASMMEMLTSF